MTTRRISTLLSILVTVAATSCAVDEPPTSETTQGLSEYCAMPWHSWCHPYYWGRDNDTCMSACMAFDGVPGFCPEYDAGDEAYCQTYPNVWDPDESPVCVNGEPRMKKPCKAGMYAVVAEVAQ